MVCALLQSRFFASGDTSSEEEEVRHYCRVHLEVMRARVMQVEKEEEVATTAGATETSVSTGNKFNDFESSESEEEKRVIKSEKDKR